MTNDDLNSAVATEVMGWTVGHENAYRQTWDTPVGWRLRDEWNPADGIVDAFDVVDRMRELGYWYELRQPASRDDTMAVARFELDASHGRYSMSAARADALARAICEAALDAVRTDNRGEAA